MYNKRHCKASHKPHPISLDIRYDYDKGNRGGRSREEGARKEGEPDYVAPVQAIACTELVEV